MDALDIIEGSQADRMSDLISRHGRDVVLRRIADGTYDAATGDVGETQTQDFQTRGMFRANVNDDPEQAATVEAEDEHCLVAATWDGVDAPFVPKDGDWLVDGLRKMRVLEAKPFRAQQIDVAWRLRVRE